MSGDTPPNGEMAARSERACQVSRRDGARSKGPRTIARKLRSAANANQHGMRGNHSSILQALPSWLAPLAAELRAEFGGLADARTLIERILIAEFNRQRAADLHGALIARLADSENPVIGLIVELNGPAPRLRSPEAAVLRLTIKAYEQDWAKCKTYHAYKKGFKGQRDRGLRQLARMREDADMEVDSV